LKRVFPIGRKSEQRIRPPTKEACNERESNYLYAGNLSEEKAAAHPSDKVKEIILKAEGEAPGRDQDHWVRKKVAMIKGGGEVHRAFHYGEWGEINLQREKCFTAKKTIFTKHPPPGVKLTDYH